MTRIADIKRFYTLIDHLAGLVGGRIALANLRERRWPQRGVYFFFDDREQRLDSGNGPRIVRVGTHGLNAGSRSTLRQRLSQHRGKSAGGGNHRGSIIRLLVGQALIERGDDKACVSWGVRGDAAKASAALGISPVALLAAEQPLEEAVTGYLSGLTFVRLSVLDEPGPDSMRGLVERNSIALLSNYERPSIDPPSANWLGHASARPLVRRSGLWNQRHVSESHNPAFLDTLAELIEQDGTI